MCFKLCPTTEHVQYNPTNTENNTSHSPIDSASRRIAAASWQRIYIYYFPGVSLFKTIYFAITGTCKFRLGLLIAFSILPVGVLSCLQRVLFHQMKPSCLVRRDNVTQRNLPIVLKTYTYLCSNPKCQ